MTKRILLAVVISFGIALLTACSGEPAQTSAVAASVALESPSAVTSSTPIQTATPEASASPSKSAKPDSAGEDGSEPAKETSAPDGSGVSIAQIINQDSVNQEYTSSLKMEGEDISVSIEEDTFTFNVTLDQDIKPADFTADMQSQYKQDMNRQIQTIISEYPDIPDCVFVYNLMNHSGESLMQLSQYYTVE